MRSPNLCLGLIRNHAVIPLLGGFMRRVWEKFGLLILVAGALAFMALPAVLAMAQG